MSLSNETEEPVDPLVAEEAALVLREEGLLLAIEDAELEAAEVAAFAADVRVRLVRHADNRGGDVSDSIDALDDLNLPDFGALSFDDRRRFIRVEAIRARQALIEQLDLALDRGHTRIDAALEHVRRARDLMLRGRLRQPLPETTVIDYVDEAFTATVVAPAIEASPDRQTDLTRSTPRPDGSSRLKREPGSVVIRAGFRRKLETRIDFTSDSNFFSGFSSNISDGGLFIATDAVMALGTGLEVALSLPDGVNLRVRCVVRWIRPAHPDLPAGLGVEFAGLDELARDMIHRFMRRRDPIFHEI